MKVITAADVIAGAEDALGVPTGHLLAVEGLAAALRRSAGFRCPCTRRDLTDAVDEALRGLAGSTPEERQDIRGRIGDTLELLIAYGDIIEEHEAQGTAETDADPRGQRELLYPTPPTFVWRQETGTALLTGIVPDNPAPVEGDLAVRIEQRGHARYLRENASEDLPAVLESLGLVRMAVATWLRLPRQESAEAHLRTRQNLLQRLPGGLTTFSILDPARPVRYYAGRWIVPGNQTGTFVARRPRGYGQDLWLFVELKDGQVERWLDLPLGGNRLRGCDEAWRLQAAIDAVNGTPQVYRVRAPSGTERHLDFFAPLPLWAQRSLDLFGTLLPREGRGKGALFTYLFDAANLAAEEELLREFLWMRPTDD